MAKYAVEVKNLVKAFKGGVKAVDRISFSIDEGDFFGFLGPNGAGKTTTMRILATLTKPTSGRALVNGFDVVKNPNEVRRSIGFAMQAVGLDDLAEAWPGEWDVGLAGFDDALLAEITARAGAGTAQEPATIPAPAEDPFDAVGAPGVVPTPPGYGDVETTGEGEQGNAVPEPVDEYVGERFARVAVGNIRGKIPIDVYGKFLQAWNAYADALGSTEVSVVLGGMIADLPAKPRRRKRTGNGT